MAAATADAALGVNPGTATADAEAATKAAEETAVTGRAGLPVPATRG